jgi:PAS domain S-box-containing protein
VDDDRQEADRMVEAMAESGLNVIMRYAVTESDFLYQSGNYPDVVLFGHPARHLSGLRALELTRRVGDRAIPFIVISSVITDEEAREFMSHGALYLSRSKLDRLAPMIARALRIEVFTEPWKTVSVYDEIAFRLHPRPMWMVDDRTLRVLAANDAACAMSGHTPDEQRGLMLTELCPPEDIQELIRHPEVARDRERRRFRLRDGRLIWRDVEIMAVVYQGRPLKLMTVLTDEVGDGSVSGSADAVDRTRYMVHRFAHHFINTFTVIRGLSEIVTNVVDGRIDTGRGVDYYLELIRAQADHNLANLERMTRYCDPGRVVDLALLDLREALRMGVRAWRARRGMDFATVEVVGDDDDDGASVMVSGHFEELIALMDALLTNAAEAMLEGGVVRVSLTAGERRLCLSVEDTGSGMTDDALRRCFTAFYTTKMNRNHGLGLTIAESVARHHHGSIELARRPGGGMAARVYFPYPGEDEGITQSEGGDYERDGARARGGAKSGEPV